MKVGTLVATAAATTATAVLGGLATDPGSRWYRRLKKPEWQPPAVAFPVVWTALYADIAVSSAAALDGVPEEDWPEGQVAYRRALAINLALNAAWSWLFWRTRRPWLAAAESAVLTASSAALVRRTFGINRAAGAALAPYALWCAFATVLSAAIAKANPRSGG
ncbi:TspO/MBR family protein [Arthrobacter sp. 92]|jgi:tryptophan-rich sensory protein|uniref:TspO/MBR family protein n=1 Tax=Arthrobacter sp. 92 TaxID=3418175 RepID=UPI003D043516